MNRLVLLCLMTGLMLVGVLTSVAQDVPVRTLELPPGAGNPRNSEGAFMTLKGRRVLFVYSHHATGQGGGHDPARLMARCSSDGGLTWTKEDRIIVENEGGMNVMSVSLLHGYFNN